MSNMWNVNNPSGKKNGMRDTSNRYSNRHTEAVFYQKVVNDQEVFASDQMNREQRRKQQKMKKGLAK